MMRFMVPTLGLVAAMVLFAGAYGDLPSWRRDMPELLAQIPRISLPWSSTAEVAAASPAPVTTPPREAASTQEADLKARVEQEAKNLALLQASAEQARRELDALHARREKEQAELSRATDAAASAKPPATVQEAPPAAEPAASVAAPAPATSMPETAAIAPRQRQLASQRLTAARVALQSGRTARARWLLNLTRAQVNHWHLPASAAGDTPETHIGSALEGLARGDTSAAVRSIEQALAGIGGDTPRPAEQASNVR